MVYIVLGMHKSGTTMLAETLHKSGINMGEFDENLSYYGGQKYEREDISHAIWDILDCRNTHSIDTVPPFNERIIQKNLNLILDLEKRYSLKYDKWGFKEPRTIFVYQYIEEKIDNHKLICIYRKPFDVVFHYLQFFRLNIKKATKALKAWTEYNNKLIEIIQTTDREYLIFNYHHFINSEDSISLLSDFVKYPLKDIRKPKKKRMKIKFYIYRLLTLCVMALNLFDWKRTYKNLNALYRKGTQITESRSLT